MSNTEATTENTVSATTLNGEELLAELTSQVVAAENKIITWRLEQISETIGLIQKTTKHPWLLRGSVALVLALEELGPLGRQLNILEQRLGSLGHDLDLGVAPADLALLMTDFNWPAAAKTSACGALAGGSLPIHLQGREVYPHFPGQLVIFNKHKIWRESPEELIFEKISFFINPQRGHGQAQQEAKWSLDIAIIKKYLSLKHDWTAAEVERYLAEKWLSYNADNRYQQIPALVAAMQNGQKPVEILRQFLSRGRQKPITAVRDYLIRQMGVAAAELIDELLSASSPQAFRATLKQLIHHTTLEKVSYADACRQAEAAYAHFLE